MFEVTLIRIDALKQMSNSFLLVLTVKISKMAKEIATLTKVKHQSLSNNVNALWVYLNLNGKPALHPKAVHHIAHSHVL